MNKVRKTLCSIILVCSIIVCMFSNISLAYAKAPELTKEQRNAIAMLNYITVLTKEINDSKNSRLYLEDAYSRLINNTYPNAVQDRTTLSQLTGLLDTMEAYRMINVKRERLQYIYDQSQAQAVRAAIPNPVGLISVVNSLNPAKLVSSIVYMAIDSYTSYTAYTAKAEQAFLKEGWALDDEEANNLHESRKDTFAYMIKMVNDYNLPGDLTLTEDTVTEFVKYKNSENYTSRIQFLESNKDTYQAYGGYWLVLAESYYHEANRKEGYYQKCIDAIASYDDMGIKIFRKDYDLAKTLPLAIAAADEIYSDEEYASYAAEKVQVILDNAENSDWALRYFAAQTLVDIYAKTKNDSYLSDAYKIILDNVNYLLAEQKEMNTTYLADVKKEKAPADATEEVQDEIDDYNKMLEDTRKTELAPVYEPLKLNCDLLFAVADELKIDNTEKQKIDDLLHPQKNNLFLADGVDNEYWGFQPDRDTSEYAIVYNGNEITIPASLLTYDYAISVTVSDPDSNSKVVFKDWNVTKVVRDKSNNDISTYQVSVESKDAKKYNWTPGLNISIEINPRDDVVAKYSYYYITEGTKNAWYDYFKVWEGYKNNWYDYAKVWENSVKFVPVE